MTLAQGPNPPESTLNECCYRQVARFILSDGQFFLHAVSRHFAVQLSSNRFSAPSVDREGVQGAHSGLRGDSHR